MPSDNYRYTNGCIKVIESTLLDDQRLQRLRELPFDAAVRQLGEWGYASEYPVRDDVDALIDFRMGEIHAVVDGVTPQKQLSDLFWLQLDAVNIKYLIKARLLGADDTGRGELEKGVYDLALLRDCVARQDYSALDSPLGALLNEADAPNEHAPDPRALSAAVDRAVYTHIFAVLDKTRNTFCRRYFTAKADFTNILSMLRARQLAWTREELSDMLIPGGEIAAEALLSYPADKRPEKALAALTVGANADILQQALALVEQGGLPAAADLFGRYLLDMAKAERFDSFGIGPLAYFTLRGIDECRRLRILFARKRAGMQTAPQETG